MKFGKRKEKNMNQGALFYKADLHIHSFGEGMGS